MFSHDTLLTTLEDGKRNAKGYVGSRFSLERREAFSVCLKASFVLAHDGEEELVDSRIVGELRMEGCGEDIAGADEGGEAVAGGKRFDAGAGGADARRADEDHLQRATGQ